MADENTYTAEQVAVAARELRQAAGSDEESFTGPQVIGMLGDEIRMLHERGFDDARIANLLTGFDICVSADDVKQHSQRPRFVD